MAEIYHHTLFLLPLINIILIYLDNINSDCNRLTTAKLTTRSIIPYTVVDIVLRTSKVKFNLRVLLHLDLLVDCGSLYG